MNILSDLSWRGLVQDISDAEGLKSLKAKDSFYVGYDPTAPSLQLGNLLPIIVSIHLAKAGLRAMQLFGGATGAIGDPSGRNTERQLLSRDALDDNIKTQTKQVQALFDRAKVPVEFINNFEWTKDVTILEFLRDIGKHFTVNYMTAKEVVKARLEGDGISYAEFSYMLLQAHDFYHLYQTKGCRLQIGGSDQWGNITAGLELIRRKNLTGAFGLSFPLITDSSGRKFGKSESGSLWLDPNRTSPYRLHQFLLNVEDADAVRYLKMFTFLDETRISEIATEFSKAPESRLAQRTLADSVCELVHGEAAVREANLSAEVLFGGSIEGISEERLADIFSEVPSSTLTRSELSSLSFVDLLVHTGLSKSKGEARRLLTAGGAYLNNQRISDPALMLEASGVLKNNMFILRSGKKNYFVVKVGKP